MKREKRLTKKERKALSPAAPVARHAHDHSQHIHCVACGKHLDISQFEPPGATATFLRCEHRTEFAACTGCVPKAKELLAEHDRTGQPVKTVAAWH